MNIAIIGNGPVGQAQKVLFPYAYTYTRHIGNKERVNMCDMAIVCIPAPWSEEQQRLDTTAIEELLSWLACRIIVIKTTLNIGDTDSFIKKYNRPIIFSPEFLRDKYFTDDTLDENRIIFAGVANEQLEKELEREYTMAYASFDLPTPDIVYTTPKEAEFTKLMTNVFLASKVTIFAQTIHEYADKLHLNPDTLRNLVLLDRRIGKSHTDYHGKWGGKCFPKDYHAIIAQGKKIGADVSVLEAILEYNDRQ